MDKNEDAIREAARQALKAQEEAISEFIEETKDRIEKAIKQHECVVKKARKNNPN